MSVIDTPLRYGAWLTALHDHPDKAYSRYLCRGILEGFRIGFDRQCLSPKSSTRNMPSANSHHKIIRLHPKRTRLGRMLGPFIPAATPCAVHISRFGVIPKAHSDKWRLITDLSHPPSQSINDGLFALSHTLPWIRWLQTSQEAPY